MAEARVVWVYVSDDRVDAAINQPVNESNRCLGRIPLPLPPNTDRPCDEGHRLVVGIHHRGLHSARSLRRRLGVG